MMVTSHDINCELAAGDVSDAANHAMLPQVFEFKTFLRYREKMGEEMKLILGAEVDSGCSLLNPLTSRK